MINVQGITWTSQGLVAVDYVRDEDIRDVGGRPVMVHHQMLIDHDHPHFDQLAEIREAAHDLVRDVHHVWDGSEVWRDEEVAADEIDDDDD